MSSDLLELAASLDAMAARARWLAGLQAELEREASAVLGKLRASGITMPALSGPTPRRRQSPRNRL